MKIVGWIGILHVAVIVGWMVINIIYSFSYPFSMNDGDTLREGGLSVSMYILANLLLAIWILTSSSIWKENK